MAKRVVAVDPDDHLSTVIQNSADIRRRRLYICGEIDETIAYRFVIAFQTMDEDDGPITVIMNSCGGLCNEGFAIYDAIRFARNEVIIVGMGQVASVAAIIMQAATRRLLGPECEFMIHDAALHDVGDVSAHAATLLNNDIQRLQKRLHRILSERSGQSLETVVRWCREETTFTSQEAVSAGFADSVLGEDQ